MLNGFLSTLETCASAAGRELEHQSAASEAVDGKLRWVHLKEKLHCLRMEKLSETALDNHFVLLCDIDLDC